MKTFIEQIINDTKDYENYVTESNGNYADQFDILLADDSQYHSEQWRCAILNVLEIDTIDQDVLDQIIEVIVDAPSAYCECEIKRGYFWNNEKCVSLYNIGEVELYEQWELSSNIFYDGIVEYLNKNTDYYYSHNGRAISAYINLSDVSIAYILRESLIKELYNDLLSEAE